MILYKKTNKQSLDSLSFEIIVGLSVIVQDVLTAEMKIIFYER